MPHNAHERFRRRGRTAAAGTTPAQNSGEGNREQQTETPRLAGRSGGPGTAADDGQRLPDVDFRHDAAVGPLPRTPAAILPAVAAVPAVARTGHAADHRRPAGAGRPGGTAAGAAGRGTPVNAESG